MSFFGADPLLIGDVDLTVVLIVIGKAIAIFALLLVAVLFYIWFMRKVIADMQNRIGPQTAGPFGILQTMADGVKLFFKEQSQPRTADRRVFLLAPYLSIVPAFLAFAIVPIGGVVSIAGHRTELQLADPAIGVLWLLMMSGLGLYGVLLAGWSSGSKYPLLGSVRGSAQLLSYEAAFGLAIVSVLFRSGTLSTRGIVNDQAWTGIESLYQDWYFVLGVGAFVVFVIAALAETNHPPFDLVEAEQELVGGFHTEYTGIRFAMFFLAEFMNLITMCAIAVTLFFGGPSGPSASDLGIASDTSWINTWLLPVFWFMLKLIVLLYATVWVRASLPRLRYDQLMSLGWKVLIEFAFLWAMATGVMVVAINEGKSGWDLSLVLISVFLGAFAIYGVLLLCMPKREDVEEIK